MLFRLGQVIYWAGCIMAALSIGTLAYGIINWGIPGETELVIFIGFAAFVWGIGRAVRYVLAGY